MRLQLSASLFGAVVCAAVAGVPGCGGGDTVQSGDHAVTQVYGEVHIHAFVGGAHPGALFVAVPTPIARVVGDDILADQPPPRMRMNGCALYDATCTSCATPRLVDGGTVHLRGGFADVDLMLDGATDAYLPRPDWQGPLFFGGETLHIDGDGSGAAPAFHGTLTAPRPILLTAPLLASGARAPVPNAASGGDFAVGWTPGGAATRVDVALIGSQPSGRWATIECDVPDADGGVAIPAALLAQLPPPPRQMQLLVSRDVLATVPGAAAGAGVVLHAGYETTLDWDE